MLLLSCLHSSVSRHTIVFTNTEGEICTQGDIDLFTQSVNKPRDRDIVTHKTKLPNRGTDKRYTGYGPFLPLFLFCFFFFLLLYPQSLEQWLARKRDTMYIVNWMNE